jgi:hypothetical protein
MASFKAAHQAGYPVMLPALTGVATSLGARQVCQRAVEWSREMRIEPWTVSDQKLWTHASPLLTTTARWLNPRAAQRLRCLHTKITTARNERCPGYCLRRVDNDAFCTPAIYEEREMTERAYYYSDELSMQTQVLSCTPADDGRFRCPGRDTFPSTGRRPDV